MKRTFAIILAALIALTVTACGKKELTKCEKAQKKAIEVCERYINFEITSEEAHALLDDIEAHLSSNEEEELFLKCQIGMVSFGLTKAWHDGGKTFEDAYESLKTHKCRN